MQEHKDTKPQKENYQNILLLVFLKAKDYGVEISLFIGR